jgi:broad specificity phosphatase PhoE
MLSNEKKYMNIPSYQFYFLRHGQTDWNVNNLIMGHQDIPLNQTGIEQAHNMSNILRTLEFDVIWSSPLLRARQTAEIINQSLKYPIYVNENLKERGWGEGEGQTQKELFLSLKPKLEENLTEKIDIPMGAEAKQQFQFRIVKALNEVFTHDNKIPLIVGHGGFFRVLTSLLIQKSLTADNCALFSICPPTEQIRSWHIREIDG